MSTSGCRRLRWVLLSLVVVAALAAGAVAVLVTDEDSRTPGEVVLPTDLDGLDAPWRHESLADCPVTGCLDGGLVIGPRAVRYETTDLAFGSTVFGGELRRIYRSDAVATGSQGESQPLPTGLFGPGWMTLVDSRLEEGQQYRLVTPPTGDQVTAIGTLDDARTALWGSGEIWQFDGVGRLERVESPTGRHVDIDWADESVTLTSDGGQSLSMALDEAGRAVTATASDGRSARYSYSEGLLTETIAPSGTERYDYGDGGLLESVSAPDRTMTAAYSVEGKVTAFSIDGSPPLQPSGEQPSVAVVGPPGRTLRLFGFDQQGRLVRGETEGEETFVREFDDSGRLIQSSVPGNETSFVYGDDGRLATVTENGTATHYAYDDLGRTVSVENADGAVTRYRYEGRSSQPAEVIDPLGGVLSMEYDSGRLVEVTDADGVTESYDYDDQGNLAEIGDDTGATTTFTYDDTGRLTSRQSPTGARAEATFDEAGWLRQVTDETGDPTRIDYDSAGRPVEVQGPGGVEEYGYDESGRVVAETDTGGVTAEYSYTPDTGVLSSIELDAVESDPVGVEIETGDGGPISASGVGGDAVVVASSAGRPTELELPGGRQQSLRYDQAGRLTSVRVDGLDAALYSYDPVGRLVRSEDANGLVEERSYDATGRLVEIRYPDDSTWSATWTPAGRLESVTDPHGNRTTWTYGDTGLVEEMTSPEGVVVEVEHDADGRVTSIDSDGGFRWDYSYDDAGRLGRADTPAGPIDYSWDGAGRLVSRVDSGGEQTRWEYDPDTGLLRRVDLPGDDQDLEWQYDGFGNVVSWSEGDQNWEVERDDAGQPVRVATPEGEYEVEWDEAGDPVVIRDGDTVEERRYDALGRLESVTYDDETFTFDTTRGDGVVESIDDDGASPPLVEFRRDARGRITLVEWGEEPDDQVEARWDHASRPESLRSGDTAVEVSRNADGQPTTIDIDGEDDVLVEYDDGQPTSIAEGDDLLLALDYAADGHLDQVRGEGVTVDFHDDSRPDTFEDGDDDGAFSYDDAGVVTGLRFGEEDTSATPGGDELEADGNDDELLQSLFAADGTYRGLPAASPVPAFSHLEGVPAEFQPVGLTPANPEADIAEDVAAIDVTVPEPLDLADQSPEDIAAETADFVLGAPLALPVHPARTALVPLFDEGDPVDLEPSRDAMWAGLIGGIADREDTTGVWDSITSAIDTAVEWTGAAVTAAFGLILTAFSDPLAFVRMAAAAARDLVVQTFTDPLFVLDAALTAGCIASFPLCSGAIAIGINSLTFALPTALAAIGGDQSVLNVVTETVAAVAIAGAAGFLIGRALRPVFHRVAGSTTIGCGQRWRVCYPADRFPETAAAYQAYLGRTGSMILTPDSTLAAANRRAALRNVPTQLGRDRDEFPYAATRQGGLGAIVTYVSPSENRAAGGWLGGQFRPVSPGRSVLFSVVP